jgi:carbon storage regulator
MLVLAKTSKLVLSRKVRETIRIGDDITITIVKVCGNNVRVSIEAPREVSIWRGELVDFRVPTEMEAV